MAQDLPNGFESREQLSALSSTAAFLSILPSDAQQEIKDLTIDIEDPRRVYKIYQASRRHNFQIFVERFIIQIRYGCQSERCTTATCYTCRKRMAGPRPLRRYNATSARNLACYLASQDNPTKSLCQYLGTSASNTKLQKVSKTRANTKGPGDVAKDYHGLLKAPDYVPRLTQLDVPIAESTGILGRDISEQPAYMRALFTTLPARTLDQPVKKDHKSFVQNVYDTVTFKMLEWMTPSNLEAIVNSEIETSEQLGDMAKSDAMQPVVISKGLQTDKQGANGSGMEMATARSTTFSSCERIGTSQDAVDEQTPPSPLSADLSTPSSTSIDMPKARRLVQDADDLKTLISPIRQLNCTIADDNTERNENSRHRPGIRHIKRNGTSYQDVQISPTFKNMDEPRSPKIVRRTSQSAFDPLRLPYGEPNSRSVSVIQSGPTHNQKKHDLDFQSNGKPIEPAPPAVPDVRSELQEKFRESREPEAIPDVVPMKSQSLSVLSIAIIEAMSDFGSHGKALDNNNLTSSPNGSTYSKRRRAVRHGSSSKPLAIIYSSSTCGQWKSFIDQSLFFVLGSPPSLLRSLTDDNKTLYDTQTLWYCMSQLMNYSMPLVIDSLWISASHLYVPPRSLWAICDWSRKSQEYGISLDAEYSDTQAAYLLSLGLHALIAAVPLIDDPIELSEIARIRAFGSSTPRSANTPSRILQSCLAYDAIFTDDLALRLARRLFASIPARRQYQYMLHLSTDDPSEHPSHTDILDIILKPLSFLNIDTYPILDFLLEERQLHEKRAPLLLIDWARTILYQDWNGSAEVPVDGPFGGALALIIALYQKRKSLPLSDNYFRTEYFAGRLSEVDMPVEWLSFVANTKTLHLLDHPYLFSPEKLVTFFRSINFSRMSRSHERANMVTGHVEMITAPRLLMMDPVRRDNLYRRLRVSTAGYLVLEVSREHVLKDAFDRLWRREERELLRPLKIHLGEDDGEEGFDSGGVQQEFFRLVVSEALNPDYGVFAIDEYTRMAWFQPGSPEPLYKFEMIGLIVSLAIFNGLTLPVTFPKALYRKLLGEPVTELHHIADGWTQLAGNLNNLLEWDEEKNGLVSDIFSRTYEFGVNTFDQYISREMLPNATWPQFQETHMSGTASESKTTNPEDVRLVDNSNRNEYVSDYIQWLTDVSIRPQFEAFQRGFNRCLAPRSLKLLDSDLLQSIVEGVQEIDIHELRRYVRYEGFSAGHPAIRDFWSIVKRYDQDQKKKLLEFVTASDRLPVGGVKNLVFVIQKNGMEEMDGHLPTSYTCYGTLLLPEYSSKEVMREKLAMALENAKGFGFA